MKCPNCGAEIGNEKVCQYCNSQIPYSMQREQELINKAGCPKCSSSNVTFKRENQGEVRGKNSKRVIHRTVGLCKDCGYTWYPQENRSNAQPKKNNMWLWILGWICIFPIPLTILMLRNKNMKPTVKYGIIAVVWVVYLLIGLSGGKEKSSDNTPINETTQSVNQTEVNTEQDTTEMTQDSTETTEKTLDQSKVIDSLVDDFNASSDTDLVFVEEFTPSDKESGHYRIEFRLNAYSEATGKSYSYDETTVDIVANTTIFGDVHKRIYMDGATLQQCEDMIKYASVLMYSSVTESDINGAIKEIDEKQEANGYYYGDMKLGLLVLKRGEDSYEFMLKYE